MTDLRGEFRQQAEASGIYVLARLFPGASTALFIVVMIRWLSPSEYVTFSLALIASMIASSLMTGWLRQAHLRFRSVDEPRWLARRTLLLTFLALGTFLAFLAAAYAPQPLGISVAVIVLTVQSSHFSLELARFQAHELPRPTLWLEISRSVVPLLLVATPALSPNAILVEHRATFGIVFLSAGYLAASFVAAVQRRRLPTPEATPVAMSVAWSYGWPLSAWLAASLTTQYVDRAMLALLASPQTAGEFAAAYDLALRGTTLVLGPLALAAQPAYMRLRAAGSISAGRVLRWALWAQSAATVIGALILLGIYHRLAPLAGLSSATTIEQFLVLFLASAAWNAALVVQKPLEYASRTHLLLMLMVVGLVINVALNSVLIPLLGVWGAIIATVTSTTVYLLSVFSAPCDRATA